MARFVLAHRNPLGSDVQRAETLWVDPADPVAPGRRRRPWRPADAGTQPQRQGRAADRHHGGRDPRDDFVLRLDGGGGGLAVCIVDTVDELNPNAANALLKVLEEPPQQSLFLLVSHAPARVLPTILSRCRKLLLRPLATSDVIRAVAESGSIAADDPELHEAADAAEGSVARALTLLGGDALKLQQRTAALLATLPRVDPRELHALGDALGGSDRVALGAFIDSVDRWVSERLRSDDANANANLPALHAGGGVGKDQPRRARHRIYNLERKPLVFSVFGLLAEATR